VLAAFALPTLKRSAAAAIDWFSMCFFTLFAAWIWFIYLALQTGWPAWQADLVSRIWIPGYEQQFSLPALLLASAGTVAWVWLVRWRTGRHREALWKSLVLPAGGVALCWMLAMTLWLQPLDYARSPRPLISRLSAVLPAGACVAGPGLPASTVAAMEYLGRWHVDARPEAAQPAAGHCDYLLRAVRKQSLPQTPDGWELLAQVQRPTDRDEVNLVYRRRHSP
jgi:4-amino-4-deoxy-L-arabinose transferase-like glycosyltransferase